MHQPHEDAEQAPPPLSPTAAAAALAAIDHAVRTARTTGQPHRETPAPDQPEQALAALLLLRELRASLADWEAPLVEAARAAGATWADLAHPMGVSSRQAAENRYLRLAPAASAEARGNGAERVKAVRDRRAAERAVAAWARDHAAELRVLAAQLTALPDLPARARATQDALHRALGTADPVSLLAPLAAMRPHLDPAQTPLAARLDTLADHTDGLRHASNRRRA